MAAKRQIPWKWLRRGAQLVCLLVFLWLFRKTEYSGHDELTAAVNWLFRLDPLVAAVAKALVLGPRLADCRRRPGVPLPRTSRRKAARKCAEPVQVPGATPQRV